MSRDDVARSRWRLVLGRYAEKGLPDTLSGEGQRMAVALDSLYGREYQRRGARDDVKLGPGSLDPSQLNVPLWLDEVRELFPKETFETVTGHALDRYGLTEMLEDPEVLDSLAPSTELLASVMMLKGQMNERVLQQVRSLVRRVVEEVRKRLEQEVKAALAGRVDRFRRSRLKVARNFDARSTIRRNLKHWDPENQRLVVADPIFFQRVRRQIPWQITLCIDQSGSMAQSVIHSAVLAGILAGLPSVRLKLVIFDTSFVDLSEYASDPVEVLMSVQLGGGTDIGRAVRYCESLIDQPRRSILVLISDFCEGADPRRLIATVRRLRESGVTLTGLGALDDQAEPWIDKNLAGRLSDEGMKIAALTPAQLARWLAEVMQGRGDPAP